MKPQGAALASADRRALPESLAGKPFGAVVNSGYGYWGGVAGNVLLAFSTE